MPARHARRRPRGSALVLSVLIMIAMLGLGLLAMRSTTQNIAGSGALRMNKTAQFVAEVGLYHAMTMMRGEAENLLLLRRPFPDSMLEIDSTGPLRVRLADGNVGPGQNRPPPPLLSAGPDALGELSASGLVASYRVVIEGFTLVQAAQVAGEEIGGAAATARASAWSTSPPPLRGRPAHPQRRRPARRRRRDPLRRAPRQGRRAPARQRPQPLPAVLSARSAIIPHLRKVCTAAAPAGTARRGLAVGVPLA
ncbi:MAG: pilus assembly PilX N-terminal domain-containing protein [bacterium]